MSSAVGLPKDVANQTFVSVKAIAAGELFLPYVAVFDDSAHLPPTEGCRVPSIAFLVSHPTEGYAMFDLGLKKNFKDYPPVLVPLLEAVDTECKESVPEALERSGMDLNAIKRIIYSHLHCDHIGDANRFPSAELVLGEDSKSLLVDAYPKNPESQIEALPAGHAVRYLDFAAKDKAIFPIGTFERAIDFYGDGSLYLVESPGHVAGHLCALARVAPNSFIFLAGDTCHNRECYCPGVRLVGPTMEADLEAARDTICRLTRLNNEADNVAVVLAHEKERLDEMPFFPNELGPWVVEEIERKKLNKKV